MTTLFWHKAGLKISYVNEFLVVEDLNPEQCIRFRMSVGEMRELADNILRDIPSDKQGLWPDWTVHIGGQTLCRTPCGSR